MRNTSSNSRSMYHYDGATTTTLLQFGVPSKKWHMYCPHNRWKVRCRSAERTGLILISNSIQLNYFWTSFKVFHSHRSHLDRLNFIRNGFFMSHLFSSLANKGTTLWTCYSHGTRAFFRTIFHFHHVEQPFKKGIRNFRKLCDFKFIITRLLLHTDLLNDAKCTCIPFLHQKYERFFSYKNSKTASSIICQFFFRKFRWTNILNKKTNIFSDCM